MTEKGRHGDPGQWIGRGVVLGAAILAVGVVLFVSTRMVPEPGLITLPTSLPPQSGCATAATPGSLCIVILGDSIGQGVPLTGDDRWWVRLQHLLATALPGRTVTIDNWAVSGSHVEVLESAARDQPEIGTYDVAIIIEGVNDVGTLSVDVWQPRYEAAVAALEARGVIPIVTTPPPSFENGAFGTRHDATAAAIRALAASGRRFVLDLATRWRADGPTLAGTYYADSIHQSQAGQVLMSTMARDVVLAADPGP